VAAMSRNRNVYYAKLAEQAERYDEMADYMVAVAEDGEELSVEERNLLSVGFKNAAGGRRAAWRIVTSVAQKEQSKGNDQNMNFAKEKLSVVESELRSVCDRAISTLDRYCIPRACSGESKVFFHKMKGDYYRYLAELGGDSGGHASRAAGAYDDAIKIAEKDLAVTHPIRLGLALNFSVFKYEVLQEPESACKLAREAFEEAIAELDNVAEDSYKDSTLIMQLLRDNLTLWTSEEGEGMKGRESPEPPAPPPRKPDAPSQKVWWCYHPIRGAWGDGTQERGMGKDHQNHQGILAKLPLNHWLIQVGPYLYENSNGGIKDAAAGVVEGYESKYTFHHLTENEFQKLYDKSPGASELGPLNQVRYALGPGSFRRPFGCKFLGYTKETHENIMAYLRTYCEGKVYQPHANYDRANCKASQANCHMLVMNLVKHLGLTGRNVDKLMAHPEKGHDVTLEWLYPNIRMFPCKDEDEALRACQHSIPQLREMGLTILAEEREKYEEEMRQKRERQLAKWEAVMKDKRENPHGDDDETMKWTNYGKMMIG